jgi:chemotaxis response regulator CheB
MHTKHWFDLLRRVRPTPMRKPAMPNLRIVVVNTVVHDDSDEALHAQAERARVLRIGLLEAGYDIIASLPPDMYLPERIAQLQPDMIIVDAESDARDVLEHIVIATRDERRPIVMFTEDQDPESMEAACSRRLGLHRGRLAGRAHQAGAAGGAGRLNASRSCWTSSATPRASWPSAR